MKENEETLLLLQIVRVNGDISNFCRIGWSYIDILKRIDSLKKDGILIEDNSTIKLSNKGNRLFNYINRKLNHRGLYKYLHADFSSRGLQTSVEDVYIPKNFCIEDWRDK